MTTIRVGNAEPTFIAGTSRMSMSAISLLASRFGEKLAEQRRIVERCRGVFFACGAHAGRSHRLPIDAGPAKGR